MDVLLTYDREKLDGLGSGDIMTLIQKHLNDQVPEYKECLSYYLGEQAIQEKERGEDEAPNAQVVCNHAKDIADTASGYFMGSPLSYNLKSGEEAKEDSYEALIDMLDKATTADDDQENALALSIYGKCYEYIYAAEGEAELRCKPIDPQNAFLVYDQSIEHTELFGVYYYQKKDPLNEDEDALDTYFIEMTETELKYYKVGAGEASNVEPYLVEQHRLGQVPLIEYKNNKYSIGDFYQQISLIDAYNTMTSDRINDKEQFIDAILVLYGAQLGDDDTDAMDELKAKKLLELPEGSSAEYLTRQLNESGMETLRDALKEDIYTFSHVPNLTDEKFAGNSSGVAMSYKLLGLEMLTKTKERWYRRGLRKRIEMFLFFLGFMGGRLDEEDVEVNFSRSLPQNLLELSQIVNNLADDVTLETRLGLLPFVEDPKAEAEAMMEQKNDNVERVRDMFSTSPEAGSDNTPPEEDKEQDE